MVLEYLVKFFLHLYHLKFLFHSHPFSFSFLDKMTKAVYAIIMQLN